MIDLKRCLTFRVEVAAAFQLVKLADQNLERGVSISAETRSITNSLPPDWILAASPS